jgi:hypothetical protein
MEPVDPKTVIFMNPAQLAGSASVRQQTFKKLLISVEKKLALSKFIF